MTNKQYIILDTNIWLYSTRLLDDAMSAALLFHLTTTGGKIVLPEIVEKEVSINLIKIAKDACREIDKQYLVLQKLFGSIDDYRLPSEAEMSQAFKNKIAELGDLIIKAPFSFSHAQGALQRILDGTPPNKPSSQKQPGDQQFKDSSIWEVAIELADQADIVFITKDYGFYENKKPDNGLAKSLLDETSNLNKKIDVFPDIQSFLEDIKDTIPSLNYAKVRQALYVEMQGNRYLIDAVGKEQTELLSDMAFKAFLTEKHNCVAINYKLEYDLIDIKDALTEEPLGPGVMVVNGNCLYDIVNEALKYNSVDEIGFKDQNGIPLPGKGATSFARASLTVGRGSRKYELRASMPNEILNNQ